MKRFLLFLCMIELLLSLVSCSEQKEARVAVLDASGNVVAYLKKDDGISVETVDFSYQGYIQGALEEAISLVAEQNVCSRAKAEETLFSKNYSIQTALLPEAYDAIRSMYVLHEKDGASVECAVLDAEGKICAIYSSASEQGILTRHSPYSTIKPLSVYAQAIEKGIMDWSTTICDEPYKQIKEESGRLSDWPQNADLKYSYENTPITACIKRSLNTAAVHGLKSVGVKNSASFLQNSFGMNLSAEMERIVSQGEEEVIGNIAMGYFQVGFTPVDLAGYYTTFANEGRYLTPNYVLSVTDSKGKVVFKNGEKPVQVFREDTAYVVNRLLSGVVEEGGTGEAAKISGVEVFGKTGTGNDGGGNWFVGVTPEYSCAVWHSVNQRGNNVAAQMFSELMAEMPSHSKAEFQMPATVKTGVFCEESGKLFTLSCKKMQVGYYASEQEIKSCDVHE